MELVDHSAIAYCSVKACKEPATCVHSFHLEDRDLDVALPSCQDLHCQALIINYLMGVEEELIAIRESSEQLWFQ